MQQTSYLPLLFLFLIFTSCQKKISETITSTAAQPELSTVTPPPPPPKVQGSNTHFANITEWQKSEISTYIQAFNVFEERTFTESDFSFYPIDPTFQIIADVILTPNTEVFEMKTSGTKTPRYREYAIMNFSFAGVPQSLSLYQNVDMIDHPEYGDYLFCPFYDMTNGDTTYGGGRYLDIRIPDGDKMLIDFNKSYNPYCAYLDKFNCPITPIENTIDVPIRAGMKLDDQH